MAKIPARKFSTAKKKIPSRPFPTAKKKIASRPFAKGTAKIPSRKFSKAPAAASRQPDAPVPSDRSAEKTPRADRLATLQGKLKSFTPASNLASSRVEMPPSKNQAVTWSHTNLFADLPPNLPDELFTTLLAAANVRIERIVSNGHASPEDFWHDQDQHEWVVVLKGAARIRFDDGTVEMKPGDFVNIPAHKKHQVEWTTPDEPTIWLAVFYE